MKSIVRIYLRDVKAIVTNVSAAVVILALMIIPSLYAWFNIKASWDPYSAESTRGIKIGIVNQDKGTELNGERINLGERVVEELKKNDQMGWQFVSHEEAMKALENEKYYAVFTIPSDFSANLTSIVSSDIKKGTIIYTVNEKMNAIAPKLTDKGVTNLQSMISETVVENVSNTIFSVANEIGVNLKGQIPNITTAYDSLVNLQGKFGEINSTINEADKGVAKFTGILNDVKKELPKITEAIASANAFGAELQTYITKAQQTTANISPMISQNLSLFATMADNLNGKLLALQQAISGNVENAPELLAQVKQQITSLNTMATTLSRLLQQMQNFAPNETITGYIDVLTKAQAYLSKMNGLADKVSAQLASGEYVPGEYVAQLVDASNKATTIIAKVRGVESKLTPALNKLFADAYAGAQKAQKILSDASKKMPEVKNLMNIAYQDLDKGERGIAIAKKVVPKAERLVNEMVVQLKGVRDEANLKELVRLLTADVAKRSDFLANPVTIKEERMYPVANYGTAMSPFYTVLCLWVGVLLLASMLAVEAPGDYKPYQVYFGKLLLYLTVTIVQALIVSLGDLYLLKITCKNPGVFVLGSILTSIIFTVIVYSLVSVFGNVGKVIGIILLVLQVAGSGGTFPIQMTPKFFQVINPFLPFTYCISFARESIGGIVREIMIRDIWIILLFIVVSILVSLVLKRPVNKLLHKFTVRFKESGISAE